MATFKLKNNQKDSGFIPGVGNFVDGVLKGAPETFENPNFELVKSTADELAESSAAGEAKASQQSPSTPTSAAQTSAAPASPSAPAAPAASTTPPSTPETNTQTEGDK